ncbi:MAG: MBL fold metallo-hydrolase, partial [Spirochaetaceae bacterium]|nr:MBL fold metallo-hydrolase [Spirochaetaceae bacterium]
MKKLWYFMPLLGLSCASEAPGFDEDLWLRQVKSTDISLLYAPHRSETGKFFNPWMIRSEQRTSGGFFSRKKQQFPPFPEDRYTHIDNDYSYLSDPDANSISFVGHASIIIKIDGATILTDPFFSNRALIIGKKVKIKFDFDNLPEHPIVLISHNHHDHLD